MFDPRLIGAAIGVWSGALCAFTFDSHWVWLFGIVFLLVVARPLPLILTVAGCVAGIGVAGLTIVASHPNALAGAIGMRETVPIIGVVATDPTRQFRSNGPLWSNSSSVKEFVLNAERIKDVEIAAPMLVRCECDVAVGSRIWGVGRISPDLVYGEHIAALRLDGSVEVIDEPGLVNAFANALRAGLVNALADVPPDAGALIAGLSVGDESAQPPTLADDMRASGLSHLTAVSGGNVAIVSVLVLGVAAMCQLGRRTRYVLVALAVLGFVILVRPQPSVLRAAVMGLVVVFGLFGGRPTRGIPTLAAAVIGLLILSPGLAISYGFALSTCATAGLLLLAPNVVAWLRRHRFFGRVPLPITMAVAATVAAQLATTPIILLMGQAVGSSSVLANLLAAPFVAPVTIGGLLIAVVAPTPLANPLAQLVALPANAIAHIAHVGATWPALPLPVGWLGVGVFFGVIAILRFAPRRWLRVGLALMLVFVVAAPLRRAGWPPPNWVFVACDVGQGDALAIRTGFDSAVVVDAGPEPDDVDRCLSDLHITQVPLLVLTHFHADHIDGFAGVVNERGLGEVMVSPNRVPESGAIEVEESISELGLTPHVAGVGERFRVGSTQWRVLWPRANDDPNPNNASIVLLVEAQGLRMLLTGDIEPPVQAEILAAEAPLAVDVIKVPHHGSRFFDPALIAWSGARVAVVSVGAQNTYGHPSPDTLAAWESAGVMVGRTDMAGDIAVVNDPFGLVVKG